MKTKPVLLLALSLAALSGCATAARHQAATTATQWGAPAELVRKMERGGRLALTDLETLARHQIPDETVLAYLRQSGAAYELTTAQIDQMREAGVSVRVIDYLLATPARGPRPYPRSRVWFGFGYPHYGSGHSFGGFGHGYRHGGFGHRGGHH